MSTFEERISWDGESLRQLVILNPEERPNDQTSDPVACPRVRGLRDQRTQRGRRVRDLHGRVQRKPAQPAAAAAGDPCARGADTDASVSKLHDHDRTERTDHDELLGELRFLRASGGRRRARRLFGMPRARRHQQKDQPKRVIPTAFS
jgi:hypothetical protein